MEIKKLNWCSEAGFLRKTRFLGLPNYLFDLHKPSELVGVTWQPGLERPGYLQPPLRG